MHKNLTDRIRGCIIGYAIGDTLGKGTEFMSKKEAAVRYPGGLRHYYQIINDAHRCHWDKRDFTLDTEIVLRLIDCITANGGVDINSFATVLHQWYESTPYEFEARFRIIFKQPDFISNPIGASRRVTIESSNHEAYNEALGRAMLLGTIKDRSRQDVIDNCRMTHYDSRCVATAVVIAAMSHALIWEDRILEPAELIAEAKQIDERVVPYIMIAKEGSLEDLVLDEPRSYWWTRKAMASALWAIWHSNNSEEVLYKITDEAGDADTNASLALGLMGLKYGKETLPRELIEDLLQKERVEATALKWAKYLETE